MTTLGLFLSIISGFIFQTAIFAGIAFYRHWQVYQGMKLRLADLEIKAPVPQAQSRKPATTTHINPVPGWSGFKEFRVQRKVFENSNRNICSFYLTPTDGTNLPLFKPGQYLTFQLNVSDPTTGQQKNIVRCYSLSDRPGQDYYRVSIKRVPAPRNSKELPPGLSSNHFHDNVLEGSLLLVKSPSGHFFLDDGDTPIVLIAGGIGITPMLSMVFASLRNNPTRELWLFHGMTNGGEQVMKEPLAKLAKEFPNFHHHLCYSQPAPGDMQDHKLHHRGHVDITLLRLTLSLKPYRFYVCGPQSMMATLVPALRAWGVPDEHIHHEMFGPASVPNSPAPPSSPAKTTPKQSLTVTFSKSGKTVPWDEGAPSLLLFAEKNGIQVDSGCRMGACGVCQTTILHGDVDYHSTPDSDPEPGKCHLCLTRPKSNLTLEA